jgi:hypothetical protein
MRCRNVNKYIWSTDSENKNKGWTCKVRIEIEESNVRTVGSESNDMWLNRNSNFYVLYHIPEIDRSGTWEFNNLQLRLCGVHPYLDKWKNFYAMQYTSCRAYFNGDYGYESLSRPDWLSVHWLVCLDHGTSTNVWTYAWTYHRAPSVEIQNCAKIEQERRSIVVWSGPSYNDVTGGRLEKVLSSNL